MYYIDVRFRAMNPDWLKWTNEKLLFESSPRPNPRNMMSTINENFKRGGPLDHFLGRILACDWSIMTSRDHMEVPHWSKI